MNLQAKVRSRPDLLLLGLIVLLGALLRLATIDQQSFRYDETVTALRIIQPDFFDTLGAIPDSESAPPFYYLLAWFWSVPFGNGEVGLRTLSALFGIAAVPVAFLASSALGLNRRAALIAALFIAVSPVLIWFSQDARVYSLVFLLAGLGLLFFAQALDSPRRSSYLLWGLFSGLAIATHYFAGFLVLPQALILLFLGRDRIWALVSIGVIGLFGLALMPVFIEQATNANASWIGDQSRAERIERAAAQLVGQDTGSAHGARPDWRVPLAVPLLIALSSIAMLLAFGDRRQKRGAALAAVVGAFGVGLPFLIGLVGTDYFNGRNSVPAWFPLIILLAAGYGATRTRWFGPLLAGLAATLALAFTVDSFIQPRLQREDFRGIARSAGPPPADGALVTIRFAANVPMRYYLELCPARGGLLTLRQVDLLGSADAIEANADRILPAPFSLASIETVSYNYTLARYVSAKAVPVSLKRLRNGALVGSRARASVLVRRSVSPCPSSGPVPVR